MDRMLIVVSVAPPSPEDLPAVLTAIDPPNVPHFDGEVRVVPGAESVDAVIAYLDDDTGPIAERPVDALRTLVKEWRKTVDDTVPVSPQMAGSAQAVAYCADALEAVLDEAPS